MKKFIIGFDKGLNATKTYEDKSLFYIEKDLESGVFEYKFNWEEDPKKGGILIPLYAYEFMCAYMNMCELPHNIGKLRLNNILATNTLTSATSMSDLLTKMSYVVYIKCNDEDRRKFEDSLYEMALNTLMDKYIEQELKDFWDGEW